MNKIGFFDISIEECGKVYSEVQKNAENHFKSADILAEANDYSNAVAHLILGSEELIKALVLFLESKNFDFREIEVFKKLFSNHKARHAVIKEFYSVIIFLKKLLSPDKFKSNHWLATAANFIINGAEGALAAINNHDWWDNAETLKQNCFYVDYSDGLKLPEAIAKEDYDKASKFVTSLKEDIRLIITGFSKASEAELNKFRTDFEIEDLKETLSDTIKRSKK